MDVFDSFFVKFFLARPSISAIVLEFTRLFQSCLLKRFGLILKTFKTLTKEKSDLEERLDHLSGDTDQELMVKEAIQMIKENLRDFENGYRKAKGYLKKRLLRKLLKQVVLSPEGLHIFMNLADGVEIPNHQIKLVRLDGADSEKKTQIAITRKASGDDSNLQVFN